MSEPVSETSAREALDRVFRDESLLRANRTLVLPSIVLGAWAISASANVGLSLVAFAIYILANIGQSHLEIRNARITHGAHLRAFSNLATLTLMVWSIGPSPRAWLLALPTMFGGLFTLSRPLARYVQGAGIAGVALGAWLAETPADLLGTGLIGLSMIAILGESLYVPLHRSFIDASMQREEAERARQESQEALEFRKTFLATMSHEIRTPMNGILGMAQLLGDTELDEKQTSMVRTILGCGDGLQHILDDILDLSKLEAGALPIESRAYRPERLLEDVVRLMRHAKMSEAVRLELRADAMPRVVRGDPRRLRQVVTNLLSNAIKFTDQGSIEVRATWREDRLYIQVSDTGEGFDPSKLKRLLQPFEQGDASTSRRHGGSGLGLAITRQLVLAMGGELTATSFPGEGSTFGFEVEAVLDEVTEVPSVDLAPVQQVAARVLLVDDNPVNLAVGSAMLDKLGCDVVAVSSGPAALEALDDSIGMVLMDCRMPEMDGFETTSRLRERGYRGPVIAVTASVTNEEREQCLAVGMADVLSKPLSMPALAASLARQGITDDQREAS
ncbi:MAG: response regulator [Deltaproteobacteria bacterium]|nr:MAG: response regulator [Deltaproteobacteria bacterium]